MIDTSRADLADGLREALLRAAFMEAVVFAQAERLELSAHGIPFSVDAWAGFHLVTVDLLRLVEDLHLRADKIADGHTGRK